LPTEKEVKYIIFNTLPPINEISGGKYTKVSLFDPKAKAEQYISVAFPSRAPSSQGDFS
jgi:hypothetical protein